MSDLGYGPLVDALRRAHGIDKGKEYARIFGEVLEARLVTAMHGYRAFNGNCNHARPDGAGTDCRADAAIVRSRLLNGEADF